MLVFHGLGMDAQRMADWTGLATRGPQAGFTVAFPDGLGRVWDDHGTGRTDGADDSAFACSLVAGLVAKGVSNPGHTFLVGLSNGACFAEMLVRNDRVDAVGIVLVSGTARDASHGRTPTPNATASVLMIEGTADPLVPWDGGLGRGLFARFVRRRVRKSLKDPSGHSSVAAEALAAEWAARNGCKPEPSVQRIEAPADDLPSELFTWTGPDAPSVQLYRVIGGGHAWPGSPHGAPAWLFGPRAQALDATGILLEFARGLA
jgi:polyhydroxybutyrate depolymerase